VAPESFVSFSQAKEFLMAAEDVANALMSMDDEQLRQAVGAGDFSGLADLDLSDAERDLLREAAADDEVEVEGHMQCNEKLGMTAGLLCNGRGGLVCNARGGLGGLGTAANYAHKGLGGSPVAAPFGQWAAIKNAQGGW
jgi:hypothetical protein